MKTRSLRSLLILGLVLALSACQTDKDKPQPEPVVPTSDQPPVDMAASVEAAQILDRAINTQHGVDRLKAAEQWSARTKGTYMGMPFTASESFNGRDMRMDVDMPDGSLMTWVMGLEHCWSKTGLVVTPCSEQDRKSQQRSTAWERITRLYPLKEPGWTVVGSQTRIDGNDHPTLTVTRPGMEGEAKLIFSPQTMLLAKAVLPSTVNHQKGTLEISYHHYKPACGINMAAGIESTFNGQELMHEHVVDFVCGPVDAGLFPPPLQVPDGTVMQKTTSPATLACAQHSGDYAGIGPAMGKLMGSLMAQKLMPMGPPIMIYIKGPGDVAKPADYQTDLCMPVAVKPPAEPEHKGDLEIRATGPTKVLSIFGLGDYTKKSGELAEALMKELAERKLKAAGAMRQVTYHEPGKVPPDQMVSEMQIPIE